MVVVSEGLEAVDLRTEKLFAKVFEFHLAQVVDQIGELVVPARERGLICRRRFPRRCGGGCNRGREFQLIFVWFQRNA